VPPEILFIERVVRLLKPGKGRACIVLPNGILGNPDDEYIRQWLLRECQILALVAMPVELFLPKVGIQTHLIFLRRKSTDEMNREARARKPVDYDIFMAIAKKVGKDRRDNPPIQTRS
jgi:type I restriction enzyme M protein